MTTVPITAHQPETTDLQLTDQIFIDFKRLSQLNHQKKQTLIIQTLTSFSKWLKQKNLSKISIKNYTSDTRKFLHWLKRLPQSDQDFHYYFLYLQQKSTPLSTFNRKITVLRCFARFLHCLLALPDFSSSFKRIPTDPIENLLQNYKAHLKTKGLKPKTITNYLLDIKHYLTWAQNT